MLGNTDLFIDASLRNRSSIAFRALQVGERVAREAMQIMVESRSNIQVHQKGTDLTWLTEADIHIQQMILSGIHAAFPDHRFIAEEGFDENLRATAESRHVWAVDPIDGTSYYGIKSETRRGKLTPLLPDSVQFGMQLCYLEDGLPKFSIFASPEINVDGSCPSVFEAVDGMGGAFLNGRNINFSAKGELCGSLASLSFAKASFDAQIMKDYLFGVLGLGEYRSNVGCSGAEFSLLVSRPKDIDAYRLLGTEKICAWDMLPGAHLVLKSGGEVRHIDGSPVFPFAVERMDDNFRLPPVIAGAKDNVNRVFEALEGYDFSQ